MKVLVTGCIGQVGWELVRCLQPLGEIVATNQKQLDITDTQSIKKALQKILPDIIVNAAAYTAVDKAEENETLATQINGHGPGELAKEAKRIGALLVHYSTDYVFDGTKAGWYTEEDTPNPVNAYGRSKLLGEQMIQASGVNYLILRTAWVYSSRRSNFLRTILKLAGAREELSIVADQIGAPTWARLIADTTSHIIRQSQAERQSNTFQSGIYNLVSAGEASWFDFAQDIVKHARKWADIPTDGRTENSVKVHKIIPIPAKSYPTPAKRPMNSRLAVNKLEKHFGLQMPAWNNNLALCMEHKI